MFETHFAYSIRPEKYTEDVAWFLYNGNEERKKANESFYQLVVVDLGAILFQKAGHNSVWFDHLRHLLIWEILILSNARIGNDLASRQNR
jgi:hypothetical protein